MIFFWLRTFPSSEFASQQRTQPRRQAQILIHPGQHRTLFSSSEKLNSLFELWFLSPSLSLSPINMPVTSFRQSAKADFLGSVYQGNQGIQCTKNQVFFRKSIGALFFSSCNGPRIPIFSSSFFLLEVKHAQIDRLPRFQQ